MEQHFDEGGSRIVSIGQSHLCTVVIRLFGTPTQCRITAVAILSSPLYKDRYAVQSCRCNAIGVACCPCDMIGSKANLDRHRRGLSRSVWEEKAGKQSVLSALSGCCSYRRHDTIDRHRHSRPSAAALKVATFQQRTTSTNSDKAMTIDECRTTCAHVPFWQAFS